MLKSTVRPHPFQRTKMGGDEKGKEGYESGRERSGRGMGVS